MPQCMAMGQATGTAAWLALSRGDKVQQIDTTALVEALTAQQVKGLGGRPLVT
jgi:hypothetical protein